jgi:hypothetical protein
MTPPLTWKHIKVVTFLINRPLSITFKLPSRLREMPGTMKLQGILLALTAWTTAAAIGIPTAVPDLSQVAIAGLTYGGSGCPPDTLGLILSNDKSAMIVFFDGFIVMIGPGIPIIENRKNCQLRVDLQHPSGFQYTPVAGTFSTNGYLGEGVTATFRSTYFFSGQAGSSVVCARSERAKRFMRAHKYNYPYN